MKIDSVRALKQEIGAEVRSLAPDPETALRYSLARTPLPEGIALGIAQDGEGVDHRLLVMAPSEEAAAPYVERAAGEAQVRVVTVTKRHTPAYYQALRRPLEYGSQVGMIDRTFVGTLGAFVRDAAGRPGILSNSHVLADEGRAQVGHLIGQPRASAGLVAALTSWVPFALGARNRTDAAYAVLEPSVAFLPGLHPVATLSPSPMAPRPGQPVGKAGRTTGVTAGTVTATEIDGLPVAYDQGVLTFDDQMEVTMPGTGDFSAPGDSGSLIVGREGYPVGLLFAGGRDAQGTDRTYANPIETVLVALGLSLLT